MTMKQVAENAAETAQGRKYGYAIQKGWLKTRGHLSCGLDNCPPTIGLRSEKTTCVKICG